MVVSQLTMALAGMAQPVQAAVSQRITAAGASGAIGITALAGGVQPVVGSAADSMLGLCASLSSPPRSTTAASYIRGSLAPSYCLTGGKTRRKRPRRPDGDPSGGGGGGDNDGAGAGGGGWFGNWDDEPEDDPLDVAFDSTWLLRFFAVLALHLLIANHGTQQYRQQSSGQSTPAMATLSQTFFMRRGGLKALPQPRQLCCACA